MIVGAGLAGLIAAHMVPGQRIVEAQPTPHENHKAVLRFRTDAVSKVTGIPFRKVNVHKGIYFEGGFQSPTIQAANLYSQKCFGPGVILNGRSVWKTDAVERFIPPHHFYAMLVESVEDRIDWGVKVDFSLNRPESPVISTAPLHVPLKQIGYDISEIGFTRKAIHTWRFKIDGADAFQTVYFPNPAHNMYRASLTGDVLAVEFATTAAADNEPNGPWIDELQSAFGLNLLRDAKDIDKGRQPIGKLIEFDAGTRKSLIAKLSREYGIYSLGRFATWRNILLDDVVDDVAVIKRLMTADDYDRALTTVK